MLGWLPNMVKQSPPTERDFPFLSGGRMFRESFHPLAATVFVKLRVLSLGKDDNFLLMGFIHDDKIPLRRREIPERPSLRLMKSMDAITRGSTAHGFDQFRAASVCRLSLSKIVNVKPNLTRTSCCHRSMMPAGQTTSRRLARDTRDFVQECRNL